MSNNVFLGTLLILEYYKNMLKITTKVIHFFQIKKQESQNNYKNLSIFVANFIIEYKNL